MAISDDVNRVFRDHERYSGDGKPGAPSGAPLPTGDPRSGVFNPKKGDIRDLLLTILQSMGNEGALDSIVAAVGAPLLQFRLPIIHDPWGLKSGGTQTIYIPRQIFARRGSETLTGTYGTDSTVFPGYVALTSTTSSFTVYLDMLDTANPYKVASYPDTPPANRPDTIAVIAEVYQYRLKTEHAHVKMEDPDKEFISFRWPIIVDGTKVRFGPFYHHSPNTGWTLYEPPAPESYWEFDLNTLQTSQWRYYFDREAAQKGQTPIKVANSGTTRPLAIDGKGVLLEIGTAINQQFESSHPVIGGTRACRTCCRWAMIRNARPATTPARHRFRSAMPR